MHQIYKLLLLLHCLLLGFVTVTECIVHHNVQLCHASFREQVKCYTACLIVNISMVVTAA